MLLSSSSHLICLHSHSCHCIPISTYSLIRTAQHLISHILHNYLPALFRQTATAIQSVILPNNFFTLFYVQTYCLEPICQRKLSSYITVQIHQQIKSCVAAEILKHVICRDAGNLWLFLVNLWVVCSTTKRFFLDGLMNLE
jgi:hypothetical protein